MTDDEEESGSSDDSEPGQFPTPENANEPAYSFPRLEYRFR